MSDRRRALLIATDLDRTLMFSARATADLGGDLPAAIIETSAGAVTGMMAHTVAAGLRALPPHAYVMPATTRTVAQFRRIALPVEPRFAVAASGGVVLEYGVPDPDWTQLTLERLRGCAPLAEARAKLDAMVTAGDALRAHSAEKMFCYAILDPARPRPEAVARLAVAMMPLRWRVALQGRKLYVLPEALHKAYAVRYVADRLGAEHGAPPRILAAGDTVLDWEMLSVADRAWVPAASELADSGLSASHVEFTPAPGHAAAAHIVAAWAEEAAVA